MIKRKCEIICCNALKLHGKITKYPSETLAVPLYAESDIIFCTCWLLEEVEMILCDNCGEWYHTICIVEAVPEDVLASEENDHEWMCQLCASTM